MNDALNAWGLHYTAKLARHISDAVVDLMPEGTTIQAVNLTVLVEKVPPGGVPRMVSSFDIRPPVDFASTNLGTVADYILRDLQDEVTIYLRRPWPTDQAGTPLHAWADEADGQINLRFRGRGDNADAESVVLPSFPVDDHPTPASTTYLTPPAQRNGHEGSVTGPEGSGGADQQGDRVAGE
jgi:hypothetical protein